MTKKKNKSKGLSKEKVMTILGAIVLAGKCAMEILEAFGDKKKKK